ncbi:hypothetical protein L6452_15638 [Arctium lappa]|uniref:Uncharacterized protein n=1 Tax=Arctium lappa TaxID=4217 RepID=A0ACB9CPC8_ARCLA|nr:hypothetical protein L6452_15638 [Arctium lappa]
MKASLTEIHTIVSTPLALRSPDFSTNSGREETRYIGRRCRESKMVTGRGSGVVSLEKKMGKGVLSSHRRSLAVGLGFRFWRIR